METVSEIEKAVQSVSVDSNIPEKANQTVEQSGNNESEDIILKLAEETKITTDNEGTAGSDSIKTDVEKIENVISTNANAATDNEEKISSNVTTDNENVTNVTVSVISNNTDNSPTEMSTTDTSVNTVTENTSLSGVMDNEITATMVSNTINTSDIGSLGLLTQYTSSSDEDEDSDSESSSSSSSSDGVDKQKNIEHPRVKELLDKVISTQQYREVSDNDE